MTPVGLTKDAGWEVGATRTFPTSLEAAWAFLLSPAGLAEWLGEGVEVPLTKGAAYRTADGTTGEVRSVRDRERVRLTWQPPGRADDATLQLVLVERPTGVSVRFHAERLHDAEEREAVRARFRAVLDRLEAALPG